MHHIELLSYKRFRRLGTLMACCLMTFFCLLICLKPSKCRTETVETDICIYGGTSGGVVAAVQVSRMGKTAVIIEPGRHLGGMTASGLSWTDVGTSERVRAIGGIAREVYERIGTHYGQKPGTAFESPVSDHDAERKGYDFPKPPSLSFEPKVAEAVFLSMTKDTRTRVHFGQRLKSVRKDSGRIQQIVTEDGMVIRASMFIDATYEGDLMAMSGVSYTVGREANSRYGETVNGVQGPASNARSGKFVMPPNPYLVADDPSSGILPYLLQSEELGEIGSADKRVQSYNYRVCLTDDPANRIPIAPPEDYDASKFELLARWIETRAAAGHRLTLRDFLKYDPLQNRKYDFNNRWAISTDFIGGAHLYPEADAAGRKRIAKAHENYLRGLFHFLASSPRVPTAVRDEMSRFGVCRDEFTDNGGWPHQLYVREARRMISDFVMTEDHCSGKHAAPNSIAMGAYGIDMHAVRRIVYNGQPINEGTNSCTVPAPYPISYGAIVPKASECENLFVTFALSASHVAFGSIRMEPVFMIVSQSAATAACLAAEKNVAAQALDYEQLKQRLLADKQVLTISKPDR